MFVVHVFMVFAHAVDRSVSERPHEHVVRRAFVQPFLLPSHILFE